ncbi:MAG: RNA polymerase sigma-70 factor [Bacteroidetes bacterium]|jgi:RNA polymerase sigma-70 factor (family 1)|nr:RNA polymerase sigma-70 factor [Bacteroidota bacterium]
MFWASFIGDRSEGMDKAQYRAVFDEHFDALRNFLYYKLGDRDVAEDIAQETFIKLWEKRGNVRMATVKTYLFTIGGNLAINHLKHMQVHYSFINSRVKMHSDQTPQYLMEEEEFKKKLEGVIASMSEGSREVFLMNRLEDMKYHEIADVLGISVKAVEKRMSKALQVLRDTLGYTF